MPRGDGEGWAPGVDVLIVDDDAAVADSTADVLGLAGMTVTVAVSVREASEILSSTTVGAVILDHHLAQVSGGAGETDCPIPGTARPPVILASAMGPDELREVQHTYGDKLFAYLAKPVPPSRLVDVVREALGENTGS